MRHTVGNCGCGFWHYASEKGKPIVGEPQRPPEDVLREAARDVVNSMRTMDAKWTVVSTRNVVRMTEALAALAAEEKT